MLEIQASELIINLSNQKKAGTLMLAIYNNAEAFEGSVVKEKRSEVGVFKGLELYLEPMDSTQLNTEIPDGEYAIAFFIDANGNKKLDKKVTKTTVWIEDIKGIMYYIDDNGNVYDPQDIIKNKVNPNIIARYEKTGETYHIPSLNKCN
jgi:hypothetical protein